MLKNLLQLEHAIESKVCRFVCDHDVPIHFIKEALFQFQKYIGQIEDIAKNQNVAPSPAEQTSEKKDVPIQEVVNDNQS